MDSENVREVEISMPIQGQDGKTTTSPHRPLMSRLPEVVGHIQSRKRHKKSKKEITIPKEKKRFVRLVCHAT